MRNKQPIFTVTTVRHALQAGSRCVGFYYTFEEAKESIIENVMDICEQGYYLYAVIEKITPGVYIYPRDETWFQWSRDAGRYESCEKPERFKQTAGWSLG
jgi:hypothetical protein